MAIGDLEAALISAPDAMGMRIGANVTGPSRETCVTLSGQVFGGDEALIARHIGPLIRGACPQVRTVFYDEAMIGARHVTAGGAFKIKSRFADHAVGGEALAELLDYLESWPPGTNPDGAGFGLFAWGGAVKRMDASLSCASGRQAEYLASFDTSWGTEASPAEIDSQLEWIEGLDRIARRQMSDRAYINFPDSSLAGFSARHLVPFADDLAAAIRRCDPHGLGRQVARCRTLERFREPAEEVHS